MLLLKRNIHTLGLCDSDNKTLKSRGEIAKKRIFQIELQRFPIKKKKNGDLLYDNTSCWEDMLFRR
jgi:hypothetical protein